MNTSTNNDPIRDDSFTRELLLLADGQEIEPPRELLDRMRAKIREQTVLAASITPARAAGSWTKRSWFAAAGAAAAVLMALFVFSMQATSRAWAQVVETVRAMPWVHMKSHVEGAGASGGAGGGRAQEAWFSFARNIGAMRGDELTSFCDFRSGIRYEYDVPKKKLYRLSAGGGAAEELESMEGLFQAIFRGGAIRDGDLFRLRIEKQRQRTVTEQGRRWIQYELELEVQGGGPKPQAEIPPISVVIRVNPEKMLPESATFTRGTSKAAVPGSDSVARGEAKIEIAFDYPAEGPADIYALGVPRNAPVEDRMPAPDLARIVRIVQNNRRDFDDYLAIAGGNDESRSATVHLIRCKGEKFRVDVGVGDTSNVRSAAEMKKWWRERGRDVLPEGSVLCDGYRVYERSLVHPEAGWIPLMGTVRQGDGRGVVEGISRSAEYFVELLAYPPRLDPQQMASSPEWTTHFDPKGDNGPAGSVRVELQLAHRDRPDDRSIYHREEFWLQPGFGYAVVKHVTSDCPEVDADPSRKEKGIIREFDGFRQTPHGVWYPTISRWKCAYSSENKSKPGGIEFHDEVTCFYLDFKAEMPDELFSKDWKGDLLTGIRFARQDEQTAAGELDKIRPPGGVPLSLGRPGQAISVEAVERSRSRLEAVPSADLEKWIDELERIIGRKLNDGLPSTRQVCRTDFVIHMSVAFDGLKWNSKAADKLLQRARTLPASEAKAWNDAFEAVLKKKIGQTDTSIYDGGPEWAVPMVLIPVDRLFDGHEYSDERAKKYLARLKQLTAADVALWMDKVDRYGGTRLDAAMNIILLDDYFDKEMFQRDKYDAAIRAMAR